MKNTQDLRVIGMEPLISPRLFKEELPMTEESNTTVINSRRAIREIVEHKDPRVIVAVGPCSIHDEKGALEYARRLKPLRDRFADRMCIIMRVYFEKPRTTIGWRGFIVDPALDGEGDIREGLQKGRSLLLEITRMGLPVATEILDPIVPQYLADLVSWAAIGARTTESQTHREIASGLSMPIGFKNSTDGNLQIAIDAMLSARHPHSFIGIDQEGQTCIVKTAGNPIVHVVLRGGSKGPNFDPETLEETKEKLEARNLVPSIMVDCSHANSGKKHERQEIAWNSAIKQKCKGNDSLIGLMLESNLCEGNQKIAKDKSKLAYGVSITDECIGWETTERLLEEAYGQLGG